jgi:potassium-transporting ATPase potassium-binding subunit
MLQGWLPLNPDGIPGMDWDLALHTTAAFITNTNQQHYAGQAQLSYFAQLFAVVAMQVITPAAGIAALVAILRTLLGPEGAQ